MLFTQGRLPALSQVLGAIHFGAAGRPWSPSGPRGLSGPVRRPGGRREPSEVRAPSTASCALSPFASRRAVLGRRRCPLGGAPRKGRRRAWETHFPRLRGPPLRPTPTSTREGQPAAGRPTTRAPITRIRGCSVPAWIQRFELRYNYNDDVRHDGMT